MTPDGGWPPGVKGGTRRGASHVPPQVNGFAREDDTIRPPAALVAAGGVFLPASLAEPVWRALREAVERRRADGGRVRPEVAQALDVLRAAALAHLTMSAGGHDSRTCADLDPDSAPSAVVPTEALAARLGVSCRHARRVAKVEGVAPIGPNCWAAEDVAALVARRRP